MKSSKILFFLALLAFSFSMRSVAQTSEYTLLTLSADQSYQTMVGFGGALAYYENWVTSHPKKAEIYEALFAELSLDILRLRNAYDYDPSMIDKAKEFVQAAENSLGKPIDVLVTSWGPPKYLKSNDNRKNGGTLKFSVSNNEVLFDYAGFAHWWSKSLDEYNANGIYPTYISIQNEPDFSADWESCILRPTEIITVADTLAGYNKALDAVYDSVQMRMLVPKFLGPENVGIGYNSVENYINALDLSKLHGIGHHLYHGVNELDPYVSADFAKVGAFHPEVPHFQTEFSRGDWWALIGQIYMALHDENVVSYFYWDLAWTGAGLIDMDNPWNQSSWSDPQKGYTKTKEFYAFKQYSAFIHPGWERIATSFSAYDGKVLTFISPQKDSASTVIINTSETKNLQVAITIPSYSIHDISAFRTSADLNCERISELNGSLIELPPHSITTLALKITESDNILVDSITLLPALPAIESREGSLHIVAEPLPLDANNKSVFWQIISGNELATLSQEGTLTANGSANGVVKLRATAIDGSGTFAELEISISNQVLVDRIDLTATGGKINSPEGTIQFTAKVFPEEAFNKEVLWEILSGSDIAELSQNGLLKALGKSDGSVLLRVSATDGSNIYKEITIQVINQIEVSSISIETSSTIIDKHKGSLQLSAFVLPENASNKTIYWEVIQTDTLSKIDQNGKLSATGLANGYVTVLASTTDFSNLSDQLEIEILHQETSLAESSESDISIWMNNKKLYYILPSTDSESLLRLCSLDGRIEIEKRLSPESVSGHIELAGMLLGMYILEYTNSDQKTSRIIPIY